jgi:superfamily II DNA or RNA helicase
MTPEGLRAELRQRELLPHQIEFIESVLHAPPRSRILLADVVGLGKTYASAALVWAWTQQQNREPRALVVSPAPLMPQWQDQLAENGIGARVIDAAEYRRLEAHTAGGENPWNAAQIAITSIDFVKQDARLRALLDASWDLVIVDEAHIARQGSQRGAVLGGLLSSEHADLVVVLSATPDLGVTFEPTTANGFDIVIRRRADEIRDWEDRPILRNVPDRIVETVPVSLSNEEREVFEAVRSIVAHTDLKSRVRRFRGEALARAAASSIFALEQSLRRAVARSEERSASSGGAGRDPDAEVDTTTLEVADLAGQIPPSELDELLELIDRVTRDNKWAACEEVLRRYAGGDDSQTLLFCDLADTAHYVTGLLNGLGLPVYLITGATPATDRHRSIEMFREAGGVLAITSSASDAFSFSFVKLCVHYDLPLNPSILAQRLGRVHRIGAPPGSVRHLIFSDQVFRTDVLARKLFSFDEPIGFGAEEWLAEILQPGPRP